MVLSQHVGFDMKQEAALLDECAVLLVELFEIIVDKCMVNKKRACFQRVLRSGGQGGLRRISPFGDRGLKRKTPPCGSALRSGGEGGIRTRG